MNKIEQYRAHMQTFALAMAQAAEAFSKMAQVVGEMAEAIDGSGVRDVPMGDDAAQPEPPDSVHKTDPVPPPPHVHEVGSCSCDGQETGPHFPAPAVCDPNTAYSDMVPKPPGLPCRVRIDNGAYMGKNATVIKALRGRKLRVRLENVGGRSDFEDSVYLDDVTLLGDSPPLPVYVPKAKATT